MSSAAPASKVLLLIIVLAAVGQMTQTMYVPSMSLMAGDFMVSPAYMQAVMACYLIPYGLSQFVYGPLSDRYGRKPIILSGIAIYLAGTLLALMAPSFELFLMGSIIQGAGIGCGGAMARTLPRDCFNGQELHRANSLISMGLIFSPLAAPLLGGYLSTMFNWQASYLFLLLLALGVYLLMATAYTESLPVEARRKEPVMASYKFVLGNRQFQGYLICLIATFSGIAVFEAAAGVLLGSTLGLETTTVSWLFVLPLPGYMLGSWLSTMIAAKTSTARTLQFGILTILTGSVIIVIPGLAGMVTVTTLIGGAFVYFLGAGVLFPTATTGALSPLPNHAGTAGAVLGGVQNLAAGIFTLLASFTSADSQLSVGAILLVMSVLSAAGLLLIRRNDVSSEFNMAV